LALYQCFCPLWVIVFISDAFGLRTRMAATPFRGLGFGGCRSPATGLTRTAPYHVIVEPYCLATGGYLPPNSREPIPIPITAPPPPPMTPVAMFRDVITVTPMIAPVSEDGRDGLADASGYEIDRPRGRRG